MEVFVVHLNVTESQLLVAELLDCRGGLNLF